MNKLLLIGLVCVPFYTYAQGRAYVPTRDSEEYPKTQHEEIPVASTVRTEAQEVMKRKIATEIPLLTQMVIGEIKSTVDEGYTMCNPDVSKYNIETIHIVAVKLRAKGYKVELVHGIMGGQLLVIDWETK